METYHRDVLRENRVMLVDNMIISMKLLSHLRDKKILLKDHVERIAAQTTSADKAAELLRVIVKRGPDAMFFLIEGLISTYQLEIAEKLDNDIYDQLFFSPGVMWE
jgi:hypothetical protein